MHRRPATHRRLSLATTLAVAAALTVAAATTAIVAAATTAGATPPPAPPPSQGVILDGPTPQNVQLVNQFNQDVSLAQLRGKYVVMANFLTLCQDECPLITAAFTSLQRDVKAAGLAKKVVFLEVTVDPGRDIPARLAAYQKEFGANWDLWTGTPANIAAFWKPFGIAYIQVPEEQPAHLDWWTGKPLTYDIDHTDGYILLDTKGHERFVDVNAPNIPHLSKKLATLLDAGGLYGLHHPRPTDWTVKDGLAALSWLVRANIPAATSG